MGDRGRHRTRFTGHTGIGAVLLVDNVDTDQIIRSRDIRCAREGLGERLFASWRYLDDGPDEDPTFVLNRPRHRDASILVVGENFGCGSSREAAVWALYDFGIRAVVAQSFGTIFYANCIANGIVPAVVDAAAVRALASEIEAGEGAPRVTVDLERTCVLSPSGSVASFGIGSLHRRMLLDGVDAIDLVAANAKAQDAFDRSDGLKRPWIYVVSP